MEKFTLLKDAENYIYSKLGKTILMATPLGLGKPNQLINLIYERAKSDPSCKLKIFTALSLDIPSPKSDMEARFTRPFFKKHFGDNYPQLQYVKDLLAQKVPKNIEIEEFYFQAGKYLSNAEAQCNYISLNYTHVAQNIFNSGVQIIVQLIAASPDGKKWSLSCNPDLTLDIADIYKKNGKNLLMVGVVHPDLPFLGGDAEVSDSFFDVIVDSKEVQHRLFAPPRASIDNIEAMIGLHASQVIEDDGTLQIGIGSLSDALVYASILRHHDNKEYRSLVESFWNGKEPPPNLQLFHNAFERGLYGTSEMLMDGFMHLRKAGILKRTVFDRDESAVRYLHGAFFLGSKDFYQWLRQLQGADFDGLSMTRVSKVNDLYDSHELALRRQRKKARFFNTCMNVTLLGGAASETLENGNVISGVGGQYNFVAMSYELPDSHSILMLRSTRESKGRRTSNIVWSQGHLTIPRHLRDLVITEYGIASLRGQNDETVIKRILNITDSEFQEELLEIAKQNKKIARDYQIPDWAKQNTPEKIVEFLSAPKKKNFFPAYPFGSDFTETEQILERALMQLKESTSAQLLKLLFKGLSSSSENFSAELERMNLKNPKSLTEKIYRCMLLGVLT